MLASVTSVWVATNWRYEQVDWQAAITRAESVDSAAAVLAVTRESAPVVEAYLARKPSSPPSIETDRAWIIVEPVREAGHRALGPAPTPALPGFATLRTLRIQAFTLVLAGAAEPTSITPGEIPGATVFPAGAS